MIKNKLSFVIALFSISFVSCSINDEDLSNDSSNNQYTIDDDIQSLSSELLNTSWTYQYSDFYNNNNGRYSHTNSEFANRFTFTFSDEILSNNMYRLIVNGNSDEVCWWLIDDSGVDYSASQYGYKIGMTASEIGAWSTCGGCIFDGDISTHTSQKLILKDYYSDGIKYIQHVYTSSSNPGGGSSGGSTSFEKPDIGFYDFSATKSSLKVQYKIYNNSVAGVSSAKVYYGTTSNPSTYKTATVNGTLITAEINGLKSGTTYYVKCEANGKAGKTTTSVTKCITNY